ncbi:MAG: nucleotidyltransferase protein [Bacilli bacterium]|nr:nucleotidyltransferase protein [Bacilli bacterium]
MSPDNSIKAFLEIDLCQRCNVETVILCVLMQANSPTAEDIRKIGVHITDLWDDYCDKVNLKERLWLSFEILQKCVESHFILNKWWAVKTKYQLEEIRIKDPKFAYLVDCSLSSLGDERHFKDLCTYVLDPIDGWMRDSWKA